jgi:acetyltransferase-like isoleucine patch superfamily enzyme
VFISDKYCVAPKLRLEFRGNNNKVVIGSNVRMKSNCRIMITGNNCRVEIGKDTTFTHYCQLEAQEEATKIIVGEDCMFSNHVLVRTNDSHYIYDAKTGDRTNLPADVHIGNHVWIAAHTTVMKGVTIGDGSVIGYRSVVTKDIPTSCVAVGTPAKVVQENVEWSREPKTK